MDLQVNMQSVMETSRAEGTKMALAASEQRLLDTHNKEESQAQEKQVNRVPKDEGSEKLKDTEKHFGSQTEAESEQEFSEDNQKQESTEKEPKKDGYVNKSDTGHIDYLA